MKSLNSVNYGFLLDVLYQDEMPSSPSFKKCFYHVEVSSSISSQLTWSLLQNT